MADIARYQPIWSGWSGGPGMSTFHSALTDGQALATAVAALFSGALGTGGSSILGSGITITYPPFAEVIDSATGQLQSTVAVTPPAPLVSTSAAVFAAPAGACVTWNTNGVVNGRRVRGRTFFVPLISSAFAMDGTLDTPDLTAIQTACTTFANSAAQPAIFHRPGAGGTGGSSHPITGGVVRDKVAVLTSRRD